MANLPPANVPSSVKVGAMPRILVSGRTQGGFRPVSRKVLQSTKRHVELWASCKLDLERPPQNLPHDLPQNLPYRNQDAEILLDLDLELAKVEGKGVFSEVAESVGMGS